MQYIGNINITFNLLRSLKDQVEFRLYDRIAKRHITINQYSNLPFNDQTLSNITLTYIDQRFTKYVATIGSLLAGSNLTNIPYIVNAANNKPDITRELVDECLNLLDNQQFIDFWNNKDVEMDSDKFIEYIQYINIIEP